MRIRYFLPFVLFTFLFSVSAFAGSSTKARELARQAVSENQTEAVSAINELRALREVARRPVQEPQGLANLDARDHRR